uniref:G-protein coupled receptors family 2 profile 2 domain-containing protein n=1 Tax=Homalodisca liturata TaxID=320908 RepID=A0A1B6HBM3_9HEMI
MEPVTTVTQRPQTELTIFRWVQVIVIIVVIACNAYYLHVVNIRYVPVSLRCEHELLNKLENFADFKIGDVLMEEFRYSQETFWPDTNTVKGCPCHLKTCVVKCCPFDESFHSKSNLTCSPDDSLTVSSTISDTTVYYRLEDARRDELQIKNTNQSDFVVFSNTKCLHGKTERRIMFYEEVEEAVLIEDGTVLTGDLAYIDVDEYCIELLDGQSRIFHFQCVEYYKSIENIVRLIYEFIDPEGWYISQACLVITLLIYVTLPQLRNLHGKLLISYLISLVLLNAVLFAEMNLNFHIPHTFVQFCVLSIPSWVTILCVDLWLVFSRPLQFRYDSRSGSRPQWGRFLIYSAFGWGIPLLFCTITHAVGVNPGISDSCPKFTLQRDPCFFNKNRGIKLLSTLPTLFMLEINFVLFLSLLFHLRNHFNQTENISTESSRRHAQFARHNLRLYFKLAFITGIDWLFIHICVSDIFDNKISGVIAIIVFYCQGFIIFVHSF